MDIREYIKNNILFLDGGMGTLLQKRGLMPSELPERWNITHSEEIFQIHRDYFDAGANVVATNTFGANSFKLSENELDEIISAAIAIARRAAAASTLSGEKWVALDIGPSGHMLEPLGDLSFEAAVEAFARTVRLGVKYGADLILIETMNDSLETKAALLAAKENSDLPVFVSNAYGEDGKLLTGASPEAMIAMLEGMGADAVGVNCSLGPKALAGVVREYIKYSSLPIIMKPNAGLPAVRDGETVYDVSPADFSEAVARLVSEGVTIVGGCCGTTPEYITATRLACGKLEPRVRGKSSRCVVSSYNHAVVLDSEPVLIGERINPTGKKRFKEALRLGDIQYILNEAIGEAEAGVHILDVNVGLPEIDEKAMLTRAVREIQAIVDLPLQIDTSNVDAMEAALRCYNGKALVNSVNGKRESMDAIFPLVKKYGGVVIALTLDEGGIPPRAEDRVRIARDILLEAEKYGISKNDIVFDPLAMSISADASAARETLRAISIIHDQLGCHTSLGVSNVSFGLPARDIVNSTFFALALGAGLSAAIMNPYSADMMKVYHSYRALVGFDDNCEKYIAFADALPSAAQQIQAQSVQTSDKKAASELDGSSPLFAAIVRGLKDKARDETAKLIETVAPLDIVDREIIPALDEVGRGFEAKRIYLPQLLMSAEAAKYAFEVIRENMPTGEAKKCPFVIATVKGDIHDIGKNIVKLLLENYGYDVIDLGKDVPPEEIVKAAIEHKAPLVGLSALMTTTVPSMEETIKQLRASGSSCKVVVGGAVLTPEYADKIGADKYARDAMETVRYAEKIFEELQKSNR